MPSEGPYGYDSGEREKSLAERVMAIEKEMERLKEENKNLKRIREELLKENEKLKILLADKHLKGDL